MKYCKKCSAELKENQKVCTKCGTPVEQNVEQYTTPNNNQAMQNETTAIQNTPPHKPMDKKTKLIIAGILSALVLLFLGYKLIESSYNPTKVGDNIASAVKDKDYDKLTKLLTSHDEPITKDQAKAYVDFIKNTDGTQTFSNTLKDRMKELKQYGGLETAVALKDYTVLKIAKDGKAFGLFDKYSFNIPTEKPQLAAQENSKLEYKYQDKTKKVELKQGEYAALEPMPIGDYEMDATKKVDDKSFKGKLLVKMSDSLNAVEKFDYAYLQVSLRGTYSIDPSNVNLIINDKKIENNSGEYNGKVGPFEVGEKVTVQAETEIDGKKFESSKEETKIEKPSDGNIQTLEVTFDEKLISKHQDELREKESKKQEEQQERTSIDVLDEDWINDYFFHNYINEYEDVKVGMSKDDVESLLGTDSSYIDSSDDKFKAYGSIGIKYDKKDKVEKIAIVPSSYSSVDEEEIKDNYGNHKYKGKLENGDTALYYDGTRGNGYVIVAVLDSGDNLKYIFQKPEEASDPWAK